MKAIVLRQPYASLVALGLKRYETRTWATRYRGPLAICAAARPMTLEDRNVLLRAQAVHHGLGNGGVFLAEPPLGAVVALVELAARQLRLGPRQRQAAGGASPDQGAPAPLDADRRAG